MKPISIRYASIKDIPSILALMEQLGYPSSESEFMPRFQRFIRNPGYAVVVVCIDESVVGFVAWSRSDIFVLDAARSHIEAIVVASDHRGNGIGKKLMEFVEEIARQHSPAIVDLTSGLRRAGDGSHEFYKRLGYKNEGNMAKLYLRKEL